MLPWLVTPRNALTAGLALALAAVSLFAYIQTGWLDSANTRADALGQRLVNANAEVAQANQAIQQARAINARLNDAIARHRAEVERLKAIQGQREALQRERDTLARQVAATARAADRARRERAELPLASEMTEALRDAVGGL